MCSLLSDLFSISFQSQRRLTYVLLGVLMPVLAMGGLLILLSATPVMASRDEGPPVLSSRSLAQPDFSLSRKMASSDRLPEGERATYTIVIENSGPGDATQATLSDTLPAGTAYIPGTAWASSGIITGAPTAIEWGGAVAAGQGVTASFDVTVTAAMGEWITNTAVISDVGLASSVVVSSLNPVIPYVNFDFSKAVTPTIVEPGERLTYTVRFTNTGRYTATNTSLVDLIPANTVYGGDAMSSRAGLVSDTTAITWTGELEVGDGVVISFSVQVSPTFHGFITNTASISQAYLSQPAERQAVAVGIPILDITKHVVSPASPAPVGPGKLLTYEVSVRNTGSIASGLLITDRLPVSTTFYAGGGFDSATGVISWTPAFSLPTGAWATFTFTVQVSPTVLSGTLIANDDYWVTSAEGAWAAGQRIETDVKDPILHITKWANPDPPGANRELVYTVRVQNSGSLATGLLVTDALPSNVAYVSGGTHNGATGLVTWTWPSLAWGDSQVFTYQVSVGNLVSGSEIVNGGYAVSCDEGSVATGGPLTLTIQPPILETSYKYADPIASKPGGVVSYIVAIRNSGASTAIDAAMTDTFPVNIATFEVCTASLGLMVECGNVSGVATAIWNGDIPHDQTVYITLATKINPGNSLGDLVNSAYITDDLLSATLVVTGSAFVTNDPFLKVTKTDSPDPVAPGRFVTYTITVQNVGLPTDDVVWLTDTVPSDATYISSDGVYITDTGIVSWTLPKLSPGDSVRHALVVQVGDVPSGTLIYNHNYGAGCGTCAPARGVTATTLVQLPMQASKFVTPGLASAGAGLTFTIVVENALGVTATQTLISDAIPAHTIYLSGSLSYPPGRASGEAEIAANGYFTWSGDIPPHNTVVLTFQAQVSPTFVSGAITNTAVVSYADLVYRPLTATAIAMVATDPILNLAKIPSTLTLEPLRRLTYTLWLTNTGREAADLVITDALPLNTSYVWSDGTLITPANIVSWTWPSLDFGQALSRTLVVSVGNVPSGTQIVNQDYAANCFEGASVAGTSVTTTVHIVVPPTRPSVFAISPTTMLNLWPLTATITGNHFVSPTTASLDGTPLTVTWVNSTTLEAIIPPGMSPGLYDLTVTNPGLGAPTGVLTEAITVTNVLDRFTFSPVSTQTAGVAFMVVITAQDAFGWTVTGYTGTATLADSAGTLTPMLTSDFVAGVVTASLIITRAQEGDTLTAQHNASTGASNPFNVLAGPLAGFVFAPILNQIVGVSFTVDIAAVDAFVNPVITYTGTNGLADTTGSIVPTTTPAFVNGALQVVVTIAQVHLGVVITTTGDGLTATSNAFDVITPVVSVVGVVVEGPSEGVVNTMYPFTATVSPLTATTPITYTWQATDWPQTTAGGGLSHTIGLSWAVEGLKIITVTAINDGIRVTDVHTITVAPAGWNIYLPTVLRNYQ